MKIIDHIIRPVSMAVLSASLICLSPLILRAQDSPQADQVRAVLWAQHVAAVNSSPRGRLLLIPYEKRITRIDAIACPDDFFHAWQKYVLDIQALSAMDRAEARKVIAGLGAALVIGNPEPLLGAVPPAQGDIARNTAVADWRNVKHVALRYGIKFPLAKYNERAKSRT